VTGIGVGAQQGDDLLSALQQSPGAVAIVHVHYDNGSGPYDSVYGLPNGGDDTSVKVLNIPDYVIDQADNQVWEVARYNGQISEARVYSDGTSSWKPYDPKPWGH
jgi:hypothetical protein